MRAVFVRPSNPSGSAYLTKFGFLPAPLSLLPLAAVLRERGDEVQVLDMEADPEATVPAVVQKIARFQPDLVGLTLHATAARATAIEISRRIKSQLPEVVTVVGGHHATFVPQPLLRGGFDVVAMGEADATIAELADAIQDHRSFAGIKGIAYREGVELHRTPPRRLIEHLDTLPMPAFDLVPSQRYPFQVFGEGSHVACIETARGCPYACDFCSVTPTWGNKWRSKTNGRILQEIATVLGIGYDWVFFTDDIFMVQPNLVQRRQLFDEIRSRGLRFRFIAQMRCDTTSRHPELVSSAAQAGLRVGFLGVESGSQETLRRMHKGIYTADSVRAVRILRENGVISLCGMMLGAPYEGVWDELHTVRFAHALARNGADAVQFSLYTPLPGTRIFDQSLRENRLFTLDWSRFDILTPVMRGRVKPHTTQLIQALGHDSFYLVKWVRGKLNPFPSNPEHDYLSRQAGRYFVTNLRTYLGDILRLPVDIERTRRLYVRGQAQSIPASDLIELRKSSGQIVYDVGAARNPYFKVGTDPGDHHPESVPDPVPG